MGVIFLGQDMAAAVSWLYCPARWLSVRLETLGALAALAAAILTVEQRGNASTFGLVLSYALSITMLTSMTVSLTSCAARTFFSNHAGVLHHVRLQLHPFVCQLCASVASSSHLARFDAHLLFEASILEAVSV